MSRYSAWSVFKNGLTGQKGWQRAWRDPEPKSGYDIVIVGAGLHGLSTAYYLAKNHGLKNIAVVEKGWLGGGNAGRNTTIVRSNYMMPGNRHRVTPRANKMQSKGERVFYPNFERNHSSTTHKVMSESGLCDLHGRRHVRVQPESLGR